MFCFWAEESPPTPSAGAEEGVCAEILAPKCFASGGRGVIKPVCACIRVCFFFFWFLNINNCVRAAALSANVRGRQREGEAEGRGRVCRKSSKLNTKQIWMKVALFTGYETLCSPLHFKALLSY